MEHYFDKVVSRQETDSAKWEFYHLLNQEADRNCIPLWVADMDFPCSEEMIEALHKRVDRKIFGYSNPSGEFYRSISGWYQHRFGWYINSESIMFSPGIVSALGFLIKILTEPGEGVLIQQPVYYPFMSMITNNERKIVNTTLVNDGTGHYNIDFDEFEKCAAEPNTKLFILCSPHNPVGRVWTVEELKRMTEICVRHGVKIVSDEIHCDLVRNGIKHIPLPLVCPEHEDEIVVCVAPSKTFNIAGLHASHIVITDKITREKWKAYVARQIGVSMMSPLAITAVEAAYYESEDWLINLNEYIDQNLQFMKEYLNTHAPKIKFSIPEATYLTWLDIREYGLESRPFWNELVIGGKVMLESGALFGDCGEGFIRLNAASPRSILEEALKRFVYTLNRVRKGMIAPDFEYENSHGENKLARATFGSNGKTVLCFLRYAGCTLCQYDIHELTRLVNDFKIRGITPVVVLQSTKENVEKLGSLPFEVICDPEQKLHKLYSIMPAIDKPSMIDLDVMNRIDLAVGLGYSHGTYEGNEQQLPAIMVINEGGEVEYSSYPQNINIGPTLQEILTIFPEKEGYCNEA